MKRLLVLGGAVLVLAACDVATTAPISMHNGDAAALKKVQPTPTGAGSTSTLTSCGTWWHSGEPGGDSVWVSGSCEEQ
jgi:hypothetical protein